MVNHFKSLWGQTAVYGVSSIVGRLINYLLIPLYTYKLKTTADYGVVTEMYAYVAFLIVMLTYGMETAFFRFNQKHKGQGSVYSTTLISLMVSSSLFAFFGLLLSGSISTLIGYPRQPEFVRWFVIIIALDAFVSIPFAHLRAQNKAKRFVVIKLLNIGLNVGLNLFFILLCPIWIKSEISWLQSFTSLVFDGEISVKYIFISNLAASTLAFILLLPDWLKIKFVFDKILWKKMMLYALPLLFFGLAGVVNEAIDRVLLKYLLPENIAMSELGIYGACYKISILMTIFIQAYKYAAEPFFFARAKDQDARQIYSGTMKLFTIVVSIIFLATLMYLDLIIYFVDEKYRVGRPVIPILLLANLFLGIFYNLSIWYKLTDQTKWGAYISIFGAIITLVLNFMLIPKIGYMGSAWATIACYGSMMIVSYFIGQKKYYIPYETGRILLILGTAIGFFFISRSFSWESTQDKLIFNSVLLLVYLIGLFFFEKKMILSLLPKKRS